MTGLLDVGVVVLLCLEVLIVSHDVAQRVSLAILLLIPNLHLAE